MVGPHAGGTALGSLIDTSVLVEFERRWMADPTALDGLPPDACIAAIQISELAMGALLADNQSRRVARETFLDRLVSTVLVVPLTELEAREHARLQVALRRAGTMIGERDLQIAATALANGHSVLTRNAREFSQVAGLAVVEPGW
jgi:tRNA(fMet)-specific endonuclease VapC